MDKSCQVNYSEFTPLVNAIRVDPTLLDDEDDDEGCDCVECCCLLAWYATIGGIAVLVMYYTGVI